MSDVDVVLIYSKADCPLCDKGQTLVEKIAAKWGVAVRKVDIESDPELFDKHRYRIPVAMLRGVELGWGRLHAATVEARMGRLLGPPPEEK